MGHQTYSSSTFSIEHQLAVASLQRIAEDDDENEDK
jgi:hypothetical protein